MPTKTLVVNFFGSPGTDKSTMTAAVSTAQKGNKVKFVLLVNKRDFEKEWFRITN